MTPSEAELELLERVSMGFTLQTAIEHAGPKGANVAFACVEKGWLVRGRVTELGQAELDRPKLEKASFAIVIGRPGEGGGP